MQPSVERQPLLARAVPPMLIGLGMLHLADWAYVGFIDFWKLVNGLGLLLMGLSQLADSRLGSAATHQRARNRLLVLVFCHFNFK